MLEGGGGEDKKATKKGSLLPDDVLHKVASDQLVLVPRRRRGSQSDPSRSPKPAFWMRKPEIINGKNMKQLHKRKLIKKRSWSQRQGGLLSMCWPPFPSVLESQRMALQ